MIDWLKESIFCVYIFHGWIFLIKGLYNIHTRGEAKKPQKKYNLEKPNCHTANSTWNVFSNVTAQKVLWSSILKLLVLHFKTTFSIFVLKSAERKCVSQSRFFFLKLLGQTASLSAGLAVLREISGLIYALSSFQSQHNNVKCD